RTQHDLWIEGGQRHAEALDAVGSAAGGAGAADATPLGTRLALAALLRDLRGLAQRGELADRRVVGAARGRDLGAYVAAHPDRLVVGQLADGEQHPEVVGDGVEAARVDELRAGFAGEVVHGEPGLVDELRLAGEVEVR